MPAVVAAKLFEWLYHPSAGLVNVLLGWPINWLGDPAVALPAVIFADVWRTMPFVAVLCYARLLAIPADVYEAAQVDGAGRFATLTRITLPLLGRILLLADTLPVARRAARVRHHVRLDRRRPRRDDRDPDGVRLPRALPDAPARVRLGGERRGLRARDGRRVGVLAAPARGGGDRMSPRARTLADLAVVLALAAYAIPFFWQLLTSFKPEAELLRVPPLLPSRLTLSHYTAVITQSVMPQALVNSLGIATLTTLVSLLAGVPAAYAVARLPLPGKRFLLLAIVASTAFPQIATVSPLYLLMRTLELRDTWTGLVLVHASFALPLTIWLLAGFVREIPIEAEEAASVDGAGPVAMFRWVIVPLWRPGSPPRRSSRSCSAGTSFSSPTRSRCPRRAARFRSRSRCSRVSSRCRGATSPRPRCWRACRPS
jgi:ABC-type glycerol-3-phosphate transport system permease component